MRMSRTSNVSLNSDDFAQLVRGKAINKIIDVIVGGVEVKRMVNIKLSDIGFDVMNELLSQAAREAGFGYVTSRGEWPIPHDSGYPSLDGTEFAGGGKGDG